MKHNPEVDKFIEKANTVNQKILIILRETIEQNIPNVAESFKWKNPVYSLTKDFAYLKSSKNHVTLGFFGTVNQLDDPKAILEGKGTASRHIKIRGVRQIDKKQIIKWLKAIAV